MAAEEMGPSSSDASRVGHCHAGLLRHSACTTIDSEDDVLRDARELARREKTTAEGIISALTRKALNVPTATVREPPRDLPAQMEPTPASAGLALPRRRRKRAWLLLFAIRDQNWSVTITLA